MNCLISREMKMLADIDMILPSRYQRFQGLRKKHDREVIAWKATYRCTLVKCKVCWFTETLGDCPEGLTQIYFALYPWMHAASRLMSASLRALSESLTAFDLATSIKPSWRVKLNINDTSWGANATINSRDINFTGYKSPALPYRMFC